MSQNNPKKGGTVLLTNSPFQPGAAPPGAPQGAPPPGQDHGAPQGGFGAAPGAPPQGGFGGPPQGGFGGPPQGGFGAQGNYGPPPGAPADMGPPGGGFGQAAPPPGGGWGAAPTPPPAGGFGGGPGAPGMAMAPAMAAAPGGAVPDYVQGEKLKLFGLDQNLAAALGYFIGLLSLVYIFAEPKEHRFVRFHAFQWLFVILPIMFFDVIAIVLVVIASTDRKLTELAYGAPVAMLPVLPLGLMALIAAFKAFQGKAWKIPVIGGFAEKMAMK